MAIQIKVAQSATEHEAVYCLRARAQHEHASARGGPVALASPERQLDIFDTLSTTTQLLMLDGDKAIGTMRVAEDNERGLPGDALYPFPGVRPHLQGRLIGIDQVCLLRPYLSRPGVLIAAMKVALQVARARGGSHLLVLVPRELTQALETAGLSALYAPIRLEGSAAWITPLYASVLSLQSPFIEAGQAPLVDLLGHACPRFIYSADELIYPEGSSGDSAFVVARGSVVLTTMDPSGEEILLSMLGPGELFGELAILESGLRVETARALAEETDVVQLSRQVFRSQVLANPNRVEGMLRLLAHRLRQHPARTLAHFPTDPAGLLLQVIQDAARARGVAGGSLLHGVTVEWLAGRVGRPPTLVRKILEPLERRGLLVLSPEGLWISDVAALKAQYEGVPLTDGPIMRRTPGPGARGRRRPAPSDHRPPVLEQPDKDGH